MGEDGNKVRVLDCESVNSIYQSLENIIGIPSEEINSFFDGFDIEEYYKNHLDCPFTGDGLLLDIIRNRYREPFPIDFTCWFHLTRTSPSNRFEEGILTLNESLDLMWDFLFSLIKGKFNKDQWVHFRKRIETDLEDDFAKLYRFKINSSIASGPFAILNKAMALRTKEIGYHDYLKCPEIIEDICICFKQCYGYDLLNEFNRNAKPCIVKFRVSGGKPDYIGAALYYLYNIYHFRRMFTDCDYCFIGNGKKIPYEDILKVEFVDYDCHS